MNRQVSPRKSPKFSAYFWVLLGTFIIFVATFVAYVQAEKEIDHANEQRHRSFLLADELRQSSDDLTRMVRTYVATGELIYKQHYQEILAIRDGKMPRPVDYQNVYWDLVSATDQRPRVSEKTIPLLDLMRQAGFTQAEFAKLSEAKANSDALTRTEYAAMVLVEATPAPTAAQRVEAVRILYDAAYHQAKRGIMGPIGEFNALLEKRTADAVHSAEIVAMQMRILVVIVGLLLGWLILSVRRSQLTILGGNPSDLYAAIARLGSGDFTTAITCRPRDEDSVLGWLAAMQIKLAGLDSQRSQAEALLRQSEAALLDAQAIARLGSYVLDIPGGMWTSSAILDQLFGIDSDYVRSVSGWMDLIHPDDRAMMKAYLSDEVIGAGHAFDKTYRIIRHADQVERWVHGQGRLVCDEEGRLLSMQGTIQDVTEYKRAADALRESLAFQNSLLDAIPIPVFYKGRDGRYLGFNRAYTEFFGADAGQLIGKSVFDISPRELAEIYYAKDAELFASGGVQQYEAQVKNNHGVLHDVIFSKAVFADSRGELGGLVGAILDISERKRAEEVLRLHHAQLEMLVAERTRELEQAKEDAEAASRAKSTFLANMSHEFRTPMSAIMGMTSMALRRAGDPKLKDQLSKIDSASRHLLAVINDILDISKIEAERLTLEQNEFRLEEVLTNLVSLIGDRASAKGLAFTIDLPPALARLPLRGDPVRLGQILLNYTANAVKFTGQGQIGVRISPLEDQPDSVLLRIEVSDTGIGIAAEDQKRLFRAFEQADGSMTRKYGGTGLGLAISKRLARLMGGEVGVDSQPGVGSTFWFSARIAKAGTAPQTTPAVAGESAETRLLRDFSGSRILLAEDEPINQEVSRGLLEEAGLVVDLAEDGQQALELARHNSYALILMDMQMPNLNGVDATRAIRLLPGHGRTPILAMTANAFEEDRKICIAAGMNDHIGKPVNPEVLFEMLLKWLSLART